MSEINDKFIEYCNYIEEHRRNVALAWDEVQHKCKNESFVYDDWKFYMLNDMIKRHDLSKYSAEEFTQYREYFYPCKGDVKDENVFETAWEHHFENNSHHWQYWLNKSDEGLYQLLSYVEMICDWQAMGYKFGGNALSYYEAHKDKVKITPDYVGLVERILHLLCDKEE